VDTKKVRREENRVLSETRGSKTGCFSPEGDLPKGGFAENMQKEKKAFSEGKRRKTKVSSSENRLILKAA